MATDVGVGLFQRIDEPIGRLLGRLAQVVRNDLVDIVIGQLTRNDGLHLQPRLPGLATMVVWRTRLRKPSK